MPIKVKSLLFIFIFIFLTSCAGTGSKIKPTISSNSSGTTNLYFVRAGGFIASGVLSKVEINGIEIARLGVKEYVKYPISGNFKIKISGAGIGGLGMGNDAVSGVADGKNYFYIIGVKQGLLTTKFTIQETTQSGYNQAL